MHQIILLIPLPDRYTISDRKAFILNTAAIATIFMRNERDIILLVSEHKLHICCPGEEAAENTAGNVLGCASDIASYNGLGPPISLPKFSENMKKYDSSAAPRSPIFSYFPRI